MPCSTFPVFGIADSGQELVEVGNSVMGPRRCFGMVLNAEDRQVAVSETFDGAVVQVDVRHFEIRCTCNAGRIAFHGCHASACQPNSTASGASTVHSQACAWARSSARCTSSNGHISGRLQAGRRTTYSPTTLLLKKAPVPETEPPYCWHDKWTDPSTYQCGDTTSGSR